MNLVSVVVESWRKGIEDIKVFKSYEDACEYVTDNDREWDGDHEHGTMVHNTTRRWSRYPLVDGEINVWECISE